MIKTIQNFKWTITTKRLLCLAALLIVFDAFDSITTYVALSIGFNEANPIGQSILAYSPFMFYFGGTLLYGLISFLMILVASDRERLVKSIEYAFYLLILIKLAPVVWNITQLIIYAQL